MLANLAAPDDATAICHNPAGLPDLDRPRLEMFGAAAFLHNEFRMMALDPERYPEINPRRCGEAGRPPCPWPVGEDGYYARTLAPESTFGIVPFLGFTTGLGILSDGLGDLACGVSVHAPNFYGGTMAAEGPAAYSMTDGYFLVLATTFAVGWRVSDRVSLGFNVSHNYMRLRYGRRASLADALTPPGEDPGTLATAVQNVFGDALLDYTGVDHGAGWTVSMLVRPAPWLSLALAYTASSPATFSGPLALRPTREGVDSFAELEALGVDLPRGLEIRMPVPPALHVGLLATPHPRLEIGLDARFWFYTVYERQDVRPLYGGEQTGLRPLTAESLSRTKDHDVTYELALGLLFRPPGLGEDVELMAGAGYDGSPVPDEYFSLDNPSLSTVLLSGGVRWRMTDHWRATLAYVGMIFVPRDIRTSRTSPPTNGQGGGHNHMPSLEIEYRF